MNIYQSFFQDGCRFSEVFWSMFSAIVSKAETVLGREVLFYKGTKPGMILINNLIRLSFDEIRLKKYS